ncbi:hypothetical protein GW915_11965, partial [bacterium]|nr:hypothetical protein [bacterium]
MKLIKKFKFLTLVAAVVAPSVFADTTAIVAPFVRGDGESYGSDVYTAYSFKTKADYAIASELLWRLSKSQIDDANPATDDPWDSTK